MALKLMAEIGLDGSGFHRGLSALNRSVTSWSSSLAARFGAVFSVAAITAFSKKTMDFADGLDKTAQRLGVGVEKLQEWQFAATQAGASAETLQTAIERLTLAASDAKNLPVFQQMGINPQGMNPEQLFGGINKWAQNQTGPEVTRMLAQLVGTRQAGTLTNIVRSDLEALGEQARKLGAVMDQQTVAALSHISDQLSIVSQVLMSNFAPALLEASKLALTAFQFAKGVGGGFSSFFSNLKTNLEGKNIFKLLSQPLLVAEIAKATRDAAVENAPAYDAAMEELAQMLARLNEMGAKGFTPTPINITPTEEKVSKGRMQSDPLLEVGNFLGQRSGVSRIGDRILDVNRQMLIEQKLTNTKLDQLNRGNNSIGVPLS